MVYAAQTRHGIPTFSSRKRVRAAHRIGLRRAAIIPALGNVMEYARALQRVQRRRNHADGTFTHLEAPLINQREQRGHHGG